MAMHAGYLPAAALSAAAFYLATRHQRVWIAAPRHAGILRLVGAASLLLAVAAAIHALGAWAGVCAASAAWMLAATLLPYLDAWRQLKRKPRDVG